MPRSSSTRSGCPVTAYLLSDVTPGSGQRRHEYASLGQAKKYFGTVQDWHRKLGAATAVKVTYPITGGSHAGQQLSFLLWFGRHRKHTVQQALTHWSSPSRVIDGLDKADVPLWMQKGTEPGDSHPDHSVQTAVAPKGPEAIPVYAYLIPDDETYSGKTITYLSLVDASSVFTERPAPDPESKRDICRHWMYFDERYAGSIDEDVYGGKGSVLTSVGKPIPKAILEDSEERRKLLKILSDREREAGVSLKCPLDWRLDTRTEDE